MRRHREELLQRLVDDLRVYRLIIHGRVPHSLNGLAVGLADGAVLADDEVVHLGLDVVHLGVVCVLVLHNLKGNLLDVSTVLFFCILDEMIFMKQPSGLFAILVYSLDLPLSSSFLF